MVETVIPAHFKHYKTSVEFTAQNIPKTLLHRHNTKEGVFGRVCVIEGQLRCIGFVDKRGEVEQDHTLSAGEYWICAPQYWHQVELIMPNTRFYIEFYG